MILLYATRILAAVIMLCTPFGMLLAAFEHSFHFFSIWIGAALIMAGLSIVIERLEASLAKGER